MTEIASIFIVDMKKHIWLSGLVYCHRILNTQMAATSARHLRTFEELCGKNALQNVILATTMWDEVDGIRIASVILCHR